jgi:hypothetical protein
MIDDTELHERLRRSMNAVAQRATSQASSVWHEPLVAPVHRQRRLVAFVGASIVITIVAASLIVIHRSSTPHVTVSATTQAGLSQVAPSVHLTSPSPTTASRPPTTANPTVTLHRFLAEHPDVVMHGMPVRYGNDTEIATVGFAPDPNHRVIEILDLTSGTASPLATLLLPAPDYGFATRLPIQTADLTGDGLPDFLVRFQAADNDPGVVVSADTGTWKLVPQSTNPADVYIGRNPTITNGHLNSTRNDCTPTCAQGHNTLIEWHYDHQHHTMVPQ